jgi:hypothetical protein
MYGFDWFYRVSVLAFALGPACRLDTNRDDDDWP